MGDAFIARSGSVGGLTVNAAVIHVNAPSGSTVDFIKGGVTAKTISPTYGHPNANDNGETADYYYAVFSGNYGTWTVTANNGSDTTSETVAVNDNKQYDVKLLYGNYLYQNGTQASGLTAVRYGGGVGSAYLTNNGTDLVAHGVFSYGDRNALHYYGTNGRINIFHRKTMKIVVDYITRNGSPGAGTVGMLTLKPETNGWKWLVSTNFTASSTQQTYTLDISNYGVVNSEYYFGITTSVGASQEIWIYIKEWAIL